MLVPLADYGFTVSGFSEAQLRITLMPSRTVAQCSTEGGVSEKNFEGEFKEEEQTLSLT